MNAPFNKKFYPVIQCIGAGGKFGISHTLTNVEIALSNGADGVFLGSRDDQKMHYADMHYTYMETRKKFQLAWIGINFRDLSSVNNWKGLESIFKRCEGVSGAWIDEMPVFRLLENTGIQMFGGITSRYIDPTRESEDLLDVCEDAIKFLDVAMTYSEKTGAPPDINRLRNVYQNLNGRIPLALAGGITPENVRDFLPMVDNFIVGSSLVEVRSGLEYFVGSKIREIANAIR